MRALVALGVVATALIAGLVVASLVLWASTLVGRAARRLWERS